MSKEKELLSQIDSLLREDVSLEPGLSSPPAPPPPPLPTVPLVLTKPEIFSYNYLSFQELIESLLPILYSLSSFTHVVYKDMIKLMIELDIGKAEYFLALDDVANKGNAIAVVIDYSVSSQLPWVELLCDQIKLQGNLFAQYLRSGVRDDRLYGQPLPKDELSYDLTFKLLELVGEYQLVGLTEKGRERVKLEKSLNYPHYKESDLQSAILFFHHHELRACVPGRSYDLPEENKPVVFAEPISENGV